MWLIFVLVVLWTGFSSAFEAIFSTLFIPLSLAALGVVLRGAGFAFHHTARRARGRALAETLFGLASVLTPFFLGTVVGAIAGGRVPVGNATGDSVTSWLNPLSILIGALFVATGAYLAAVFLVSDARRAGAPDLERYFATRALVAAVVAGALAAVDLVFLHRDARYIFDRLTDEGLPLVIISAVCGIGVLVLLHRRVRRGARPLAVGAVAAVIWGWGVAQWPYLLPREADHHRRGRPERDAHRPADRLRHRRRARAARHRPAVHAGPAQPDRGNVAADAATATGRRQSDEHERMSTAPAAPRNSGLVLTSLILVAAVANLNLSVANVALPSIGDHFDSGQTTLDLIAVGYSLGLACSVLWLGALGDRYGRKIMLLLGTVLAIPMSLLAAYAPSDTVLFIARVGGGLAAGMAYPTTLALITALWLPGAGRTKSIALWSGIGGAIAALGPLASGVLLEHFYWGSVFLLTLPLAVVAIVMAWRYVPAHVNEGTEPVDNLGGLLSLVLVGALILGINFAPVPNATTLTIVLAIVAVVALGLFFLRQRRARNPLYDLAVAARPPFWVAACAGIIVFGSLMGAMFIGQQFLQNVLGYSTLEAGLSILPAAFCMVLVAPRSAKIVEARGARFTLLVGYVFVLLGFLTMLLLWKEDISYWRVGLGYALVGIGVGLAGTPASHSLTGSVPVRRAGMASGTADLQRDLGGAIMQSIFGALLTAGYATAAGTLISSSGKDVSADTQAELTKSFSSAVDTASRYPASIQDSIVAGAKTAFLQGDQWAYTAGIVAVLLGAVVVFLCFPKADQERELLSRYHAEDVEPRVPLPSG